MMPYLSGIMLLSIKAGPSYLMRSSILSTAAPFTLLSSSSVIIISKRGTTIVRNIYYNDREYLETQGKPFFTVGTTPKFIDLTNPIVRLVKQ